MPRRRPPGSSGASRVPSGAVAARRCPGSSSGRSIPEHSTRSQPSCRPAWRSSPRRTARRRRARCSRASSVAATGSPGTTPAPTSPPASPPPSSPRPMPISACSRSTSSRCPEVMQRVRPRVVSLGNLFRDQLDRYGELEHIAERWRAAVATLPPTSTLVVNADDPLVADLADGRAAALRFGVDDPRLARPALQHAADSKYCIRCGEPVRLRGGLRRSPRRLPLPELRARAAHARCRRALDRPAGARRVGLRSRHTGGHGAGEVAAARSLQRLQRPRSGCLCARPRRLAGRDRRRARDVHGGVRPLRADRGRRQADPDAADQEPRRCERGDPDARGGRGPRDIS